MTYSRQPNVVRTGTGLKQNPLPTTTSPPGVVPVTIEANIATTSELGVIQVGSGLSITLAGVLSVTGTAGGLVNVTLVSSNYSATLDDYYIGATKKSITITLPKGVVGKIYIIKNQTEGSITVKGTGQNLDNSGDKNLGTEASLFVVFDGSRWNIVT
jgi:hypothetical protein